MNGGIAVEARVRAQEVVVGSEKDGESERAVAGIEAAGGAGLRLAIEASASQAGVIAIGTVEAFDELFEGTPLGGLVVEVFEAEDLVEGEGGREVVFFALGVEEVNAGGIGAEAVEDQVGGAAAGGGASDLVHGDRGIAGIASVCDVVAGDLVGLSAGEEEGIGPFAADLDIDFIAGAEGVGGARVGLVEASVWVASVSVQEAPCLTAWGETTHFFRKRNVLSALMTQRTENF